MWTTDSPEPFALHNYLASNGRLFLGLHRGMPLFAVQGALRWALLRIPRLFKRCGTLILQRRVLAFRVVVSEVRNQIGSGMRARLISLARDLFGFDRPLG